MKHLYTAFAISTLALSGTAFAHDHEDAEARPTHYEAQVPADAAAAFTQLQTNMDEIAVIMTKAELDSNDLEAVHAASYSLEAAVERLEESAESDVQKSAVENLEEIVETLHHESEDHEVAETREAFAKLQPAIDVVEASFKTAAE